MDKLSAVNLAEGFSTSEYQRYKELLNNEELKIKNYLQLEENKR
jgi:hypothetical protein